MLENFPSQLPSSLPREKISFQASSLTLIATKSEKHFPFVRLTFSRPSMASFKIFLSHRPQCAFNQLLDSSFDKSLPFSISDIGSENSIQGWMQISVFWCGDGNFSSSSCRNWLKLLIDKRFGQPRNFLQDGKRERERKLAWENLIKLRLILWCENLLLN